MMAIEDVETLREIVEERSTAMGLPAGVNPWMIHVEETPLEDVEWGMDDADAAVQILTARGEALLAVSKDFWSLPEALKSKIVWHELFHLAMARPLAAAESDHRPGEMGPATEEVACDVFAWVMAWMADGCD